MLENGVLGCVLVVHVEDILSALLPAPAHDLHGTLAVLVVLGAIAVGARALDGLDLLDVAGNPDVGCAEAKAGESALWDRYSGDISSWYR